MTFVGDFPVTGEFPAQRVSNAENVSIWWRHHVISKIWSDRLGRVHNFNRYMYGFFWIYSNLAHNNFEEWQQDSGTSSRVYSICGCLMKCWYLTAIPVSFWECVDVNIILKPWTKLPTLRRWHLCILVRIFLCFYTNSTGVFLTV